MSFQVKLYASFLFVFLFIFSQNGLAYDDTHSFKILNDSQYDHSLLYPDNNVWVYEVFRIKKDQLQSKVFRRVFSTKKQAIKFAGKKKYTFIRPFQSSPLLASKAPIWENKNSWSLDWEIRYSRWISNSVDKNFFVRHKIPSDCADVAVALRWIFSRINYLPAGQSLAASGQLFTNLNAKASWKHLPRNPDWTKDKLFQKSLHFIINNTYTRSLLKDSYPIQLAPNYLNEGAYWLTLSPQSGHAVFIHKQNKDGLPLQAISSTVPSKIRVMEEAIFIPSFITSFKKGGMVKPRWVKTKNGKPYLFPAQKMPGYSLEQYKKNPQQNINFGLSVLKKIDENFVPKKIYQAFVSLIIKTIGNRQQIVTDGYAHCENANCAPGSANFENWSTPSRDRQMGQNFKKANNLLNALGPLDPNLFAIKKQLYQKKVIALFNKSFTLEQIEWVWKHSYFSSNPKLSPRQRWGLTAKAFVKNVTNKIKKNVNEKLSIINKNECQRPHFCPAESSIWLKNQTLEQIAKIKTHIRNLIDFCFWQKLNCKNYYKQHLYSLNMGSESFFVFANRIYFSSFDPRSTAHERQGVWPDLYSFTAFYPEYLHESKSYLVSKDITGLHVTGLKTMKRQQRKNIDGQIIAGTKSSDILLIKNEDSIYFYDISLDHLADVLILTQKERLIKAYLQTDRIFIFTTKKFVVAKIFKNETQTIYRQSIDLNHLVNIPVYFSNDQSHISFLINSELKMNFYNYNLISNKLISKVYKKNKQNQYFIHGSFKNLILLGRVNKLTWSFDILTLNLLGLDMHTPIKNSEFISTEWLGGTHLFAVHNKQYKQTKLFELSSPEKSVELFACQNCTFTNSVYNPRLIQLDEQKKRNKKTFSQKKTMFLYKKQRLNRLKNNLNDHFAGSNGLYIAKEDPQTQLIKIYDLADQYITTLDKNSFISPSEKNLVQKRRVQLDVQNRKIKYRTKTYFDKDNKAYPLFSQLVKGSALNTDRFGKKSSYTYTNNKKISQGLITNHDYAATWFDLKNDKELY